MAKIDCSTVVGFAREASRLCEMYEDCGKCPMTGHKKCPMAVLEYDNPDVQSIIDALQKWSYEHPVKTRLDDIKERCPNVPLDGEGFPCFSPAMLGYCGDCDRCRNWKNPNMRNCWHEPLVGGATGKAVE